MVLQNDKNKLGSSTKHFELTVMPIRDVIVLSNKLRNKKIFEFCCLLTFPVPMGDYSGHMLRKRTW